MKREGFFCPICGHRMEERSFEETRITKLTSDDLREEDEGLLG
jgi:hypothetical protein